MPARLACAFALEAVVDLGHNYIGCEHLLVGLSTSEGGARDLLGPAQHRCHGIRQAIGAAALGAGQERSRTGDHTASVLADLTRRLEAMERRLAAM